MFASALDFQGLYTFPNPLSKVPSGACVLAENLVGNKDGTAESRRGFGPVGTSLGFTSGWIGNIFGYQNHLITQGAGSVSGSLFYEATAGSENWTAFASTYTTTTADPYFATVGANKNIIMAGLSQTTPGPGAVTLKMSAYNSEPIPAGVPPGLDGSAVLAGAGAGFLGAATQCAYQIVFGYVDVNGNLMLGNPSERILIVNATGGADNVTLTFTVPQGLTTSYFYQIYRTPQTTYSVTPSLNIPPGAEPQLAAQFNLTGGQIAALSVTVTDVTPDVLLGASLYTNPSQQGATQTNDRPPFAYDACLFNQMLFYGNTVSLPILNFSMISVGAPNGVQVNDTIIVNGITFTGKAAQNNALKEFKVDATGTVSQNIDATARNLINCINANANTTLVYAFYLSGYNQLPGLIALQSVSGFSNFVVTSSRGGAYSPVIPAAGTTFISSTNASPNGLMISKVGQPEAVPLTNILFVGGGDQSILRILPLRDRTIVSKTDGVFVVTGSTPSTLSVTLLDSTIICIARGTAKVLNNSVYLLSQQGVVSITESGVTIQSRAIESDVLAPSTVTYATATFTNLCSATSYESERLYILQMPTASTDQYPTQCYCYNWVTNVWTHWPVAISYGYVNPLDNKLYVGMPQALTPTKIYQERKSYTYEDYYDDQTSVTISSIAAPVAGFQTITISSTPSTSWIGQNFSQLITTRQFLTASSGTFTALTNGSPITVECIGGGGAGGAGGGGFGGGGAGGGEYRKKVVPYTSGSLISYLVGAGGTSGGNGGPTIWGTNLVLANGGTAGGPTGTAGAAGSGGIGTTGFNGGAGSVGTVFGSGGGGGGGGPNGVGGAGATVAGGGGGNGGGAAGNPPPGGSGGSGGNNFSGIGGGAGGANNAGGPGQNGSNGTQGGGGGAGGGSPAIQSGNGGAGGNGIDWDTTHGSGGGGGSVNNSHNSTGHGGAGGLYGGGGGGGCDGSSAAGGQGLIVVTYANAIINSAIITSVNTTLNTVTISIANSTVPNTTLPWATGAAFVEKPIPLTMQQTAMTGNYPHYMKAWGRMNFWFNAGNFQTITVGSSDDVMGPTLETMTLVANVPTQPVAPNFPMAMHTTSLADQARWIMPYLSLSFARARFSCLGVTASYDIVSDVSA